MRLIKWRWLRFKGFSVSSYNVLMTLKMLIFLKKKHIICVKNKRKNDKENKRNSGAIWH